MRSLGLTLVLGGGCVTPYVPPQIESSSTSTGTSMGDGSPTMGSPSTGTTVEPSWTGEYACDDQPGEPMTLRIGGHVCATRGCALQCWGSNLQGQLGHPRGDCGTFGLTCRKRPECCLGDDEVPRDWGDVDLGEPALQVAVGREFTCALLTGGRVRCWGTNEYGQLGLGHPLLPPPWSVPADRPDVKLGGVAVQIAAGGMHACALLNGGAVRCWGHGWGGALGHADIANIGDDELPSAAGDVVLGGPAVAVVAGGSFTCALMAGGAVRCWGWNNSGELGLGHTETVGDNELPVAVGEVPVGAPVVQLEASGARVCAITATGGLRCWGKAIFGHENKAQICISCSQHPGCCIGDDELPQDLGDIPLDGPVAQVAVGGEHICALLEDGRARCWGRNTGGELGLGLAVAECDEKCTDAPLCCVGDDEAIVAVSPLDLGAPVEAIAAAGSTTCALLAGGKIRCWGPNGSTTGYGNMPMDCAGRCGEPLCCLGDDEPLASLGDVPGFSP